MSEIVLPADEVQALLDDLAPACIAKNNPGRVPCPNVAEWIVTLLCACGAALGSVAHCSRHLQEGLAGGMRPSPVATPQHCGHGRLIVTNVERIRSKPTK